MKRSWESFCTLSDTEEVGQSGRSKKQHNEKDVIVKTENGDPLGVIF